MWSNARLGSPRLPGAGRMPRTTTQAQARAAARERQAQKNEARRRRDEAEVEHGANFEVARQRRDDALGVVAASEVEMGRAVAALFELGNQAGQVAVLTGEAETEVKRLRRLATDADSAEAAQPAATPVATPAGDTDAGTDPRPDTVPTVADAASTTNGAADRDRTELAAVPAGKS
jgi:hypothetical protein